MEKRFPQFSIYHHLTEVEKDLFEKESSFLLTVQRRRAKAATITTSGRHVSPGEDVVCGDYKSVCDVSRRRKKKNKRDDDSAAVCLTSARNDSREH